ncbi:MAG TPA: hypothetical protein VNN08_09180, partial [Thermoanaerobaculia bacterium]|nr:hypothetical protein [Thermoanaerobaculia bacterium]
MRRLPIPVMSMLTILIVGTACLGNEKEAQAQKKPSQAKPLPRAETATPSSPDAAAGAYRAILYPKGVPRRRSIETGTMETPSFDFVAAAKLRPAGRTVVLYAEEIATRAYSDHEYHVFLASVDDAAKRVLDRVSLTDMFPLQLEFPGNFINLDGVITMLDVPSHRLLDVTTLTSLSGSGGISAMSDFFFTVDGSGKLTVVLQLPVTGGYGRGGWSWARSTSSELFIAPSGDEIAIASWTITRTLAKFG